MELELQWDGYYDILGLGVLGMYIGRKAGGGESAG